MKILTIANRKGGAGKSTCAAHLAVEAVKNNLKTILIDMDPQKTLEMWWKKREDALPALVDATPDNLPQVLDKLSHSFDLCIIDTPGDTSMNAIVSIKSADIVIIPSKPTAPDLAAIGRTISIVEENKKRFIFVITQITTRTKAAIQAASVLSQFGALAPASISNRISYANAMGSGSSATLSDKIAVEEVFQVWNFIKSIIFSEQKMSKQKLHMDSV
jgi:chromosome partitioning protein